MQTIQYMGSKARLLPYLDSSLDHFLQENSLKADSFLDAFSGSGRVSYHFRNKFTVKSVDKLHFSKVIISTYLNSTQKMKETSEILIKELNSLPLSYFYQTDQWFTNTYGGEWNNGNSVDKQGVRKIWLTKNSIKIDMIRHKIKEWKRAGRIQIGEEAILLTALILSINKVSNIVGHQNGYLKEWCSAAQRDIKLLMPCIEVQKNENHVQHTGDIFSLLEQVEADISYFDPPYGTNNKNLSVATRYSSFYHLWNTLVVNDRPEVFGRASKPVSTKGYTEPLEKNKKEIVFPKFVRLIEEAKSSIVAFSYSNKGLLTARDFEEVFRLAGCDMQSFRTYITSHKGNNQTKLAHKKGVWIDRPNPNEPLTEYFFIACKSQARRLSPERITKPGLKQDNEDVPCIKNWLLKKERFDLPPNSYRYFSDRNTIVKV